MHEHLRRVSMRSVYLLLGLSPRDVLVIDGQFLPEGLIETACSAGKRQSSRE